jgi:hypothetical protein
VPQSLPLLHHPPAPPALRHTTIPALGLAPHCYFQNTPNHPFGLESIQWVFSDSTLVVECIIAMHEQDNTYRYIGMGASNAAAMRHRWSIALSCRPLTEVFASWTDSCVYSPTSCMLDPSRLYLYLTPQCKESRLPLIPTLSPDPHSQYLFSPFIWCCRLPLPSDLASSLGCHIQTSIRCRPATTLSPQ